MLTQLLGIKARGSTEGIQEPLARIGGTTYLMDGTRRMTMAALDMGEKPSRKSNMVAEYLGSYYSRDYNGIVGRPDAGRA